MIKSARFILVFLIWLLATRSCELASLAAGVVFSVLVVVFASRSFPQALARLLTPARCFWLLFYLPFYLYFVLKADLYAVCLSLRPEAPTNSGVVQVRTTLRSNLGKAFLANFIALAPGVLSANVVAQEIHVCWRDLSARDRAAQTDLILNRFEPMLRRIFE